MSNVINLSLLSRLDRPAIDAAIADGVPLDIFVANEYSGDIKLDSLVSINDMDAPTLAALKTVLDYLSYDFEATYPVVKIAYDAGAKAFGLSASYVRDAVSTASPSPLAAGFPVTVRFEFPGFLVNTAVEVTARYGELFDTDDIALLAENGVAITGTGDAFSITNVQDCRVFFSRPVDALGHYIIQYPAIQTIILKTA